MEEGCYSKASKEGILKPCGTGLKSDTSIETHRYPNIYTNKETEAIVCIQEAVGIHIPSSSNH